MVGWGIDEKPEEAKKLSGTDVVITLINLITPVIYLVAFRYGAIPEGVFYPLLAIIVLIAVVVFVRFVYRPVTIAYKDWNQRRRYNQVAQANFLQFLSFFEKFGYLANPHGINSILPFFQAIRSEIPELRHLFVPNLSDFHNIVNYVKTMADNLPRNSETMQHLSNIFRSLWDTYEKIWLRDLIQKARELLKETTLRSERKEQYKDYRGKHMTFINQYIQFIDNLNSSKFQQDDFLNKPYHERPKDLWTD